MFWERVEPHMTDRLEKAVDHAYRVFGIYQLSETITYCDCNVCMTPEVAFKLSQLPLKEITASVLAEYTNSAHGYDSEIELEFKYFLPRYLDLIAQCDPPSHLGLETCLVRLDGYRDRWPSDEIEAVDAFFDAFAAASVHQLRLKRWPVGLRLEYDLGEVISMIVLAGGNLERTLAEIDRGPDPEVGVHLASMRRDIEIAENGASFDNAHIEDHDTASKTIAEWLSRKSVDERIRIAPGLLQDPNYDDVLKFGGVSAPN